MSANYTDMTGVLTLKKVTPVINALFGALSVTQKSMAAGTAMIQNIGASAQWDDVLEKLNELITSLRLPEGKVETIGGAIRALAAHLKVELDETALTEWEAYFDDGYAVTNNELFWIASILDDGHGLTAIKSSTAWYSDTVSLGEFGGEGNFTSNQVNICFSSNQIATFGQELHEAIAKDDTNVAAEHVMTCINAVFGSITDPIKRAEILRQVQGLMTAAK